jgi:type IV secretory pathway VirB10-like protein
MVARYRRKMVIGIVSGAVIIAAVASMWGLTHSNHIQLAGQAKARESTFNQSDVIGDGDPKNYSDYAIMQRRKLAEEQQRYLASFPPADAAASDSATLPRNYIHLPEGGDEQVPAQTPQVKEDTAVSSSGMFFRQDPNAQTVAQATRTAVATPTAPTDQTAGHDATVYGDQPLPAEGQGSLTVQKNAFLANGSQNTKDYVSRPLQSPLSAFEVQAGSIIPAALITAINSDLPGEIIAQVTEPVYDSPTGQHLLIPQGARLIGKYDSLVSYGQSRALVLWNRLVLPNGKSVPLEAMPGTDETGTAGLEDEVDHHRLEFYGAVVFSTVLDVGPSLAQSLGQGGTTNVYTQPASQLGSQTSQMGSNVLQRELNRPNTITIRQGSRLRVLLNKDIILEEYKQG